MKTLLRAFSIIHALMAALFACAALMLIMIAAKMGWFSSECTIQGVPVQSQSVVTIESNSAYKVQVTSSGGGRSTKERLIAKRVGEC